MSWELVFNTETLLATVGGVVAGFGVVRSWLYLKTEQKSPSITERPSGAEMPLASALLIVALIATIQFVLSFAHAPGPFLTIGVNAFLMGVLWTAFVYRKAVTFIHP